MVALAWRGTAAVDRTEAPDRPERNDAAARETIPGMAGSTLPADVFMLDVVRDDSPAIGFVMAVLLSMPLWGILIGAGVYLVGAF